jgi:MoaA/NifB/PqqE/SkfB family radical SAM enzyme
MTFPAGLREAVRRQARGMPFLTGLVARYRRRQYEKQIGSFLERRDGRAGQLPQGVVYEATMRCNLHCEFCYVGTLLNIEGEWREELPLEVLRRAFPEHEGLQVSLTGGEIFMRKDILQVMDVFREKGYVCGFLTTNGTIITEERAEALAKLAEAGFLKHISVSIDGPNELHDKARGVAGTFERTAAGLRRLQAAAAKRHAPLRVSVNTTVSHETLDALTEMVDVASDLGVDAIGLNHLMYSTPEEVDETVRLIGATDASVISTFVTRDPGLDPARVRSQVDRLIERCRERNIRFDMRPKVKSGILEPYYQPGSPLEGRCLYPFLYARVSFSGKAYFCPFIRIEVGDLTTQSLEEVWTGDKYVALRKSLVTNGIFPVCRRCCKVELTPSTGDASPLTTETPIAAAAAAAAD